MSVSPLVDRLRALAALGDAEASAALRKLLEGLEGKLGTEAVAALDGLVSAGLDAGVALIFKGIAEALVTRYEDGHLIIEDLRP